MPPRVRFAPSPTGYLHVGGARTALFNWLFARHHGGVFVLRIEDTDAGRSSTEMVDGILEGLRWLGLDWDEGPEVGGPYAPYYQSERRDRYRIAAMELVAQGHAYRCYCSADRLRDERERAEQRGEAWKYDRACLSLSASEMAEREARGPGAIRFKVPEGQTAFDDGVHGRIEFEHAGLEDFVIVRSDGQPTYHLSVVVDDIDMRISHVVRGDDHISNTPKHLLLFGAMGAPVPHFAHVPLILGVDKKRLSKRHGATSVMEYERAGYLPEAMVNFLALLGWSPGDDREVMSRRELIDAFALEGIGGGSAVFDAEKLDWMNGQYIARLPVDALVAQVEPRLREAGCWPEDPDEDSAARVRRFVELVRPRAKRILDFVDQLRPFLVEEVEYEDDAVRKHLGAPNLVGHMAALHEALKAAAPFDELHVEGAVRGTAAQRGVKAGDLIHATRVAVTGRTSSPGLFEVLVALGKERTLGRVSHLVAFLSQASEPGGVTG